MRIRPEVAHALALGPAHHLQAGELLVEGDREERIRLVVAVLHVEPRVELLDPGELQLEGLDLGPDRDPVHTRRGGHHLLRTGMQRPRVGEVGIQAIPQVLGLADIDHAAGRVAETIDAW